MHSLNSLIYNFPLVPTCIIVVCLYAVACLFFRRRRSYFEITAFLAILFLTPLCVRLSLVSSIVWADAVRYIAYCVTISIFAAFLFALCNISRYTRVLKYAVFTLLLAPIIVCLSYYIMQHAFLNVDGLIAIWQTNLKEAAEYLLKYMTILQLLLIILYSGLLFFVLHFLSRGLRLAENCNVPLLIFFLCVNALACRAASSNSLTLIFTNARQDIAQYRAFKASQQKRNANGSVSKLLQALPSHEKKGVYILVIGESHTREYTHAYGYPRKDSPWLDKMSREKNCLLFTNAYACHTQTVPVLSMALTAKNQYNGTKLENAVSLIEAVRAAGFETVWLSNQMKYGVWDTPVAVIASAAAQQKWLNNSSGNSTFTASYDAALVSELDNIKLKDKMLIVVHLMGSHINYDMRYPSEFDRFGTRTDEDSYCNSLLYNDFVMKSIYEKARQLPNFKALLYVSDHASIPKDKLDHDSARFTPSMTHIPMYLCLSEDYAAQHRKRVAALQRHKDAYFTNDLLFNLQLSLMGITLPSVYEPQNDLASFSYNGDKTRFRTSGGKRKLK